MRLFSYLAAKIGDITIKSSNLPESYIKRSMEQVYWRTPRGKPQYLPREISRRRFRFGVHRPWTAEFRQQNAPNTHHRKVFIEPVGEWSFFKGDRVQVLTGRDKGKQGVVSQIIQERNWVLVEGLNTRLKRVGQEGSFPGVCIREEKPLLVVREVKLVDPETLLPTDVQWRYTEEGQKVRVSVSSSRIIPIPKQAEETKDYKSANLYLENKEKDTPAEVIQKVTFSPELKTFDMDVMESMGIKEDRTAAKTYWY